MHTRASMKANEQVLILGSRPEEKTTPNRLRKKKEEDTMKNNVAGAAILACREQTPARAKYTSSLKKTVSFVLVSNHETKVVLYTPKPQTLTLNSKP